MKRYINEYWPYLLALFPVLLLRDFSPASELRYVSLATELINGHHFFCLTWQGESFPYITPLYVWLVALLKVVLRHHYMITIATLLSFIPSMVILGVMNRWVERYDARSFRLIDGSQSRILASIMLFTCGLQLYQSFFVGPEMLFEMWVVLALYTFWRILGEPGSYGPSPDKKRHNQMQWLFGLYVFLAIFTKGPIGLALTLLPTTVYLICSGKARRWFEVWNWRAWLIIFASCGSWLYFTYLEGGLEWIQQMMVYTPLSKMVHPASHDQAWYYYLVSLWIDSLPWGPVSLIVLIISLIRRVHHHEFTWAKPFGTSLQNFFVTTFLVMFIFFSMRSYKLDVNLLPLYPFLVYGAVMQLEQWRWPVRWNWRLVWICRFMLLLIFIGGCLCPWLNIQTGCYGRICYGANRLERELHTEKVYVYHLRRTEGMDAYLHQDPIPATPEDIAAGKLQNTLLIMKEFRLEQLRYQLDQLGVPKEKQGEVVHELGAFVILHFD